MVFSISLTCPLMSQCWLILLFDPWRSRSWLRPCSHLCSMVLLSMYRKAFLSYLKEWQQEMSSHIDSQHHFFTHRFKRQPRRRLFAALISVRADIGGDNSVFSSSRHNKSRFLVIATSFFYIFFCELDVTACCFSCSGGSKSLARSRMNKFVITLIRDPLKLK